jgi:hypothetical protein
MRAFRVILASGGLAVLGCSLLVETSDLDAGCAVGQKLCPDYGCVALDDAAFGCEPDVCVPCERANAIPSCENGRCAIGSCVFPYGCSDCHANLLTDEENCGTCSDRCSLGERCEHGACVGSQPFSD